MKEIYLKIWELAKPFYEKGRPMDIDHIEWMMKDASWVCEKEGLDDTLLLPLVILHDVGYSEINNVAFADYYQGDTRKVHMASGEKIARDLLAQVNYQSEKAEKIAYYVSVHDNWALGEIDLYVKDPIIGTFKDLDFIWIYTAKGFPALMKVLHKNEAEMLEHLHSETSPIYGKKPFSNSSTKMLYDKYLAEREKEYSKNS